MVVHELNKDKWADFKGIFEGMLKISKLAPVLQLAQLRDKISEAARKLLT